MTELKTLKDLENTDWDSREGYDRYLESWIRISDLKKEAIKWVKERLNEQKERDPLGWKDYAWCVHDGDFNRGEVSALEKFFNITEEDLK